MNRHADFRTCQYLITLFLAAAVPVLAPPAAHADTANEIEALDAARFLASETGPLHIVLTGIRPGYVTELAEAWTVRDAQTGEGVIFVYTGSAAFRCAMWPIQN